MIEELADALETSTRLLANWLDDLKEIMDEENYEPTFAEYLAFKLCDELLERNKILISKALRVRVN